MVCHSAVMAWIKIMWKPNIVEFATSAYLAQSMASIMFCCHNICKMNAYDLPQAFRQVTASCLRDQGHLYLVNVLSMCQALY